MSTTKPAGISIKRAETVRKASWWKELAKNKYLYMMLVPIMIWYLIFRYAPMYGVILSFQKFSFAKGIFGSPFVGFENFVKLFSDSGFITSISNTFIINILKLLIGFPMPIIFAILLSEIRNIGYKRLVQTVTYLPHFVSWVVLAGILNLILAQDVGVLNHLLGSVGIERANFLTSNEHFRGVLILSDIWKEMGWNSIIYLAGIAGINPLLYEAAFMDGAGRWARIKYITVPCLGNVIAIMFILNVGSLIQMGFDQIYNLYNPAVYETADIIDTYIVRNLQRNPRFGVLSAASTVKAFISLAFLLAANRLVKFYGQEGIY